MCLYTARGFILPLGAKYRSDPWNGAVASSPGNVTTETAFGRTGSRLAVFDPERKFAGYMLAFWVAACFAPRFLTMYKEGPTPIQGNDYLYQERQESDVYRGNTPGAKVGNGLNGADQLARAKDDLAQDVTVCHVMTQVFHATPEEKQPHPALADACTPCACRHYCPSRLPRRCFDARPCARTGARLVAIGF